MPALQDQAAIVTGAGSGIGRATAERFAREGAHVLCVEVDGNRLGETVEGIAREGDLAAPHRADVSKSARIRGRRDRKGRSAIAVVSPPFPPHARRRARAPYDVAWHRRNSHDRRETRRIIPSP